MEKAPDSPGSENKWVEEEGRGRENDSDSNSDWMEREIKRRIEAFADLNEGEMNFFKLWNSHITSLQGVGFAHMPAVVLRFVETQGVELLEQNLYRNLTAHLTVLQKLNIVEADTILRNILNLKFKFKLLLHIFICSKQNSEVVDVAFKIFFSAFSQLQKIIGSRAIPELESSWQNIWSLNTSKVQLSQKSPNGLLKEKDEGSQYRPARRRSSSVQFDQNSNIKEEKSCKKVLNSIPTFSMDQLFSSRRVTRIGAEETYKEFLEGVTLTSRIMKEGLRHPAVLKDKELSWTRVKLV